VASHLTVTTAANPGVASKGLNANADAGSNALGAFAALLDSAGDAATKSGKSTVALGSGGLVDLSLDLGADTDKKPDETPDAIAAAINATGPIQDTPEAILAGLIDGLKALQATIDKGQTPAIDDLTKLNQQLDALAKALGVSLDALPSLDQLAAMAAQTAKAGAAPGAQLAGNLAPMALALLTDANGATDAAAAAQLKALGDKLAALAQKLNDGTIAADKLAALAALAKPAATVTTTPALGEPKLETKEPALTGKAGDAATAETADPTVKADTTAKPDGDDKTDKKAKQAKVDATPPATVQTADATPDSSTAQSSTHATTRIEAMPGPRPVIAGYQTSQQQLNLPQIAFELVRQVNDGNSRFQMRLDPPELGRIDVRLDIDKSGQVTARLTVEKAETLDLMQRDQRGLEKALQQAGLDSSKTNLEFSLKQNPFSGGQQQNQGQSGQPRFSGHTTAETEDTPPPQINLYRASLSASGVNIIA
jgi:hypothetical protein